MFIFQFVCFLRVESSKFLKRKIENNEEYFVKWYSEVGINNVYNYKY